MLTGSLCADFHVVLIIFPLFLFTFSSLKSVPVSKSDLLYFILVSSSLIEVSGILTFILLRLFLSLFTVPLLSLMISGVTISLFHSKACTLSITHRHRIIIMLGKIDSCTLSE